MSTFLPEDIQQPRSYFKIIITDLPASSLFSFYSHTVAKLIIFKLKSDTVPLLIKILEAPPLSWQIHGAWFCLPFQHLLHLPTLGWSQVYYTIAFLHGHFSLIWDLLPPSSLSFTWLLLFILQFSVYCHH